MKKNLNLPVSFRWTVFLAFLFIMTGCVSLRGFFGDPNAPGFRGCSLFGPPTTRFGGGCAGRSIEEGGAFGPYGYQAMMGHSYNATGIFTRDMGFSTDEPHYIPITRSRNNS